jgi:hypothetical protein
MIFTSSPSIDPIHPFGEPNNRQVRPVVQTMLLEKFSHTIQANFRRDHTIREKNNVVHGTSPTELATATRRTRSALVGRMEYL